MTKDPKNKKDTIISSLKRLSDNLGWKVIKKVLQQNIQATEEKLHGNAEWEKGDTLEGLQNQRNDRVELLALPKAMVEDLKDAKEWPIEYDPYE